MTFELGINYWPRRTAMYMWRELDLGEVRDEMAQIATLGFDVVRVFILAQDFLPKPLCVAGDMIAKLLRVIGVAKDARLKVVPTIVVINMSGRSWWPGWMLGTDGRPGDLFSDPTILRSQAMLAETCARALSGEDSIRAFDLANEIDDAQRPRTRGAARNWASTLASAIRTAAPGAQIRVGAHIPSLTTDNNMRVDDIASIADEDVMHAYPMYSEFARSSLDPEFVPFACALTAELSGAGRQSIMQEFGVCTAPRGSNGHTITDDFLGRPVTQYLASEDEQAIYYDAVLENLVQTGAAGAYAWCYADYDPHLFDRDPFVLAVRERTFGLVRPDGTEKPAATVLRRFSQRRHDAPRTQPAVPRVLDVSADEYYSAPSRHFARLYAKWIEQRAS